ncbi:BOS complex subunit NOMO3 [Parasteatoda tepidariorum]|uniref:BOS complex subunit NOMO3 n=1 Tax=Parasteatoda tepidariorum TaxID=114398 RepID=UPI001C71A120|nr:nodal modulator 3 [Parasteatoda tepidariorum]
MLKELLIVLFISLCLSPAILCDDIFGCGGFVKSNFTINYSRVEIKLYTKHGSLKYHTDCAPHNGYYLIPLYDKGDYVLKIEPPLGWSFEPSSVSLHVDGKSDPCSLNQDINFNFKGFTVSGQVLSRDGNTGPVGIKLKLKDVNSKVIKETISTKGGHYSFSELFPGKYKIEGSHETWLFDQSLEEIQVTDDNYKTRNKIVIAGYDVSGSVFSDGQPIQGVHFLLFSQKPLKSPSGCNTDMVKGFSHTLDMSYICHTTSSNNGKFVFPSLPPGSYKLVPFYKGEHIEFDVSPPKLDFVINEGSFHIPESFQVQGFSVSGWIGTKPKGKSLQNVSVYINDEIHGVSDANGIYHLENMRAGTYHLEMKKELLVFESKEMKINPNTPRLPDIYVSKFYVCGQLIIEEYPAGLERSERSLILKSLKDNEELIVQINVDFTFCLHAAPGKYTLEPKISETEASFGLKFMPVKQTIEVIDEPLLNIKFKQFRAEVKGKVNCIEKCSDIVLDLAPLSHDRPHLKAITDDLGYFEFEKCLPGNYILSLVKDEWCFQSKTLKFTIVDKDILNLELYQTGFQSTIILTHASAFKVKYPSGEFHDIELHKSKNAICLPEKGIYDFIPVGCHLYKKDSFKFDTSNPLEINLSPIKHLVTGNILTEANVTDIKVHVKKQMNAAEDIISLQEPLDLKGDYYRYTFSVFAPPNSDLELKALSKQLLFRPPSLVVKVGDDCLENAVEIIGKRGLFLNGSVTPAIEGVNIKVISKSTDNIYAETTTDKAGVFIVGPLEDDSDYVVQAEIEGYVFTPLDTMGHFEAFKLAEIVVHVKNEDGSPLAGVLLSLTGGSDYRKNSVTQKNGKLSFTGLGPGQYFLRSMLKEFSFNPPSKMIDIKEGAQMNIEITGKRVAYSLYGVVTSLTGEAEIGVAVEAVGVKEGACSQYQEEALSESGGAFRIRGLQPGCEYMLHLKPGTEVNQHIERSTPKELLVKVSDGDITGVRLIVFRYYGQLDVSGNVITNQEYLSTLKVRLYREDIPDQVVHSLTLGQSNFFYLPAMPIDNKVYTLQLESSLPSNSYFLEQPSVTFCANTTFYHFTMTFQPRVKSVEQEVTQGSFLALPFTIICLILAYNYTKLIPLFTNLFLLLSSFSNPGKAQSSTETSSDSLNLRKKTRPKRIQ